MASGKKVVADKNEVLENFTEIMRDGGSKNTEKMKAAEFVFKYGDEDRASGEKADGRGVMIVDDIPQNDGG